MGRKFDDLAEPLEGVDTLQQKVMRNEELTPDELKLQGLEQNRFNKFTSLSSSDAARLSDKNFRKWEYSRAREQYRNATDFKAAEELHEALLLRGDKNTAKIVRDRIETGRLGPNNEFVENKAGQELFDKLERRAGTPNTVGISKRLVEDIDNLFEDYYTYRILTPKQAGQRLLEVLQVLDPDGKLITVAEDLITKRAASIDRAAVKELTAKNAVQAIYDLATRNKSYRLAAEESAVYLSRKASGRFATLMFNVNDKVQRVWLETVNRKLTQPFAEANLMTAMIGPQNLAEDAIRSALGDVIPGRASIDDYLQMTIGTKTDQSFKSYGVSSWTGMFSREAAQDYDNWVVRALTLGNKKAAFAIKTATRDIWGEEGMMIRRNFVMQKFMQEYRKRGGEIVEKLMKAGPLEMDAIVDKEMAKLVKQTVNRLKTTGRPDVIRSASRSFTHANIMTNEVRKVLLQHPELDNSIRQHFIKSQQSNELFSRGLESIDAVNKEAEGLLLDKFITSPKLMAEQIDTTVEHLLAAGVESTEDVAQLIRQTYYLSSISGATPGQVLARATVRNRGMKLTMRRADFDSVYDDLNLMMDKAQIGIGKVIQKIKATSVTSPEYKASSDSLLDLLTTKSQLLNDWSTKNIELRRDFFHGKVKKDLTDAFWNDFYNTINNESRQLSLQVSSLDGRIAKQISNLNRVAGDTTVRPPIIVTDRALAPADIAQLLNVDMNDITSGLLRTMVAQNDKDFFIQYVLNMVEAGDVGFTKESIGSVYDQIISGLTGGATKPDWIASQQLKLNAVKQDLMGLYGSKKYPQEVADAIKKYIDGTADEVQKLALTKEAELKELSWADTKLSALEMFGARPGDIVPSEDARFLFLFDRAGITGEAIKSLGKPVSNAEARVNIRSYRERLRLYKEKVQDYSGSELDTIRQDSWDEAQRWYYKEYPDYTNANAIDDIMKQIYPYWIYESQRYPYMLRAIARHPVVGTTLARYMQNTDNGKMHIPGTNIDVNPFSGTVFGGIIRLSNAAEYSDYYNEAGIMTKPFQFNEFVQRYGFYPGQPWSGFISLFGGGNPQLGEEVPSLLSTPMNLMIAIAPNNRFVNMLTEKLLPSRFRDYTTSMAVTHLGGDGTTILAKIHNNEKLTEEEQDIWDSGKRQAALYNSLAEMTSIFRLNYDEKVKAAETSAQIIFQMTGITPVQQEELKRQGKNVWDVVGGIDPNQQKILQELDLYKWVGTTNALLPAAQQAEYDRLELD
jgi:hypothetical protein